MEHDYKDRPSGSIHEGSEADTAIEPVSAIYPYQFTPQQLMFLCQVVSDTANVSGNIAEIGCAHGYTTLFLNRYIDGLRCAPKTYFAIDTFSGFAPDDVEFEVRVRYKAREMYDAFRDNSVDAFRASMVRASAKRVTAIQADVNHFDLRTLGEVAFAIVDVDLYRPVSKALPELYESVTPGGVIVVDDCNPTNFYWDGAYEAYQKFVKSINRRPEIVHGKLGVIRM